MSITIRLPSKHTRTLDQYERDGFFAEIVEQGAGISPADAELLAWDAPDLQLCHPIELDPQRGIDLAIECERLALGRDARAIMPEGIF